MTLWQLWERPSVSELDSPPGRCDSPHSAGCSRLLRVADGFSHSPHNNPDPWATRLQSTLIVIVTTTASIVRFHPECGFMATLGPQPRYSPRPVSYRAGSIVKPPPKMASVHASGLTSCTQGLAHHALATIASRITHFIGGFDLRLFRDCSKDTGNGPQRPLSFPRSAWECRLRRSASSSCPRGRSACPPSRWGPQSGPAGIPTPSVGTRNALHISSVGLICWFFSLGSLHLHSPVGLICAFFPSDRSHVERQASRSLGARPD